MGNKFKIYLSIVANGGKITYPSFSERFFDENRLSFQRRQNPILNRLEYMISFFSSPHRTIPS